MGLDLKGDQTSRVKEIKPKSRTVRIVLIATFCALILSIIGVWVASQYGFLNRGEEVQRITAARGNIFDRNGIPMATNRTAFSIEIIQTDSTNDELNTMLLKLYQIFEKNNDNYENSLTRCLTFKPIDFASDILDKDKEQEFFNQNALQVWINDIADKKEVANVKTPKEIFNYLRNVKFKIAQNISDEDAYKIMTLRFEHRGYSKSVAQLIAQDVSQQTVAEVKEKSNQFPGIRIGEKTLRKYVDAKIAAHVIGYVGNISASELTTNKGNGYLMTDYIGKIGIEQACEADLKGKDGEKRIKDNLFGKQATVKSPTAGKDITLTIDMKLQKIAMDSLEKQIKQIRESSDPTYNSLNNKKDAYAGAVVAMDVNSGEILAMGSYPSYDPSIFLAGPNDKESQKAKTALFDPNDEGKPQLNRAISGRYEPGSAFKPLVSIAALEEGVITPDTTINDTGHMTVNGVVLDCLEVAHGYPSHGAIDVKRALATSCNIFFYDVGLRLGIEKIDAWAKKFGLGEYTDIEIRGEDKGLRSNLETHDSAMKQVKDSNSRYPWSPLLTAFSSIGQLYNAYTPIQLAGYTSTIANGGKKYKAHVIKSIATHDGQAKKETKPEFEEIKMKPENIKTVQAGMIAVANSSEGTVTALFDPYKDLFTVAAKTATSEASEKDHSNNGLFVSYAPANKPKIAVVVVIQRGVYGYFAAPVAADIFVEYFKN